MTERTDIQFATAVAGAAPSADHLRAWPTISRAAQLIGRSTSVMSRAMDADGVPKHPAGRRDKKVAPASVLRYARVYGADVDAVAAALMDDAEASGAAAQYVESVEQDIGAWMAGRARRARIVDGAPSLEALVAAIREIASPQEAAAILERAQIKG